MNPKNLTTVALCLALAWSAAAQAEVAGRVLVAVGDTVAVRGSAEIRLAAGTPVEKGDTLRVGDASNLQVRFTDEAIMALRPNSTVRIDDYAFVNKADSDKSLFSLVKGGLRTITGIIGRNSRKNYAVTTETSTIGIRGTHFNLVQCAGDCRNPDGSVAQNGTFGGVTDGRIAVTNNAGEREFGKNEFFFVASKDALPAGLLAPPPFLRDRLEGQAKSKGKGKGEGDGGQAARTAANTGATTQPTVSTPPLVVATEPFKPGDQPDVSQTALVAWVDAWGGSDYINAEGTGFRAEAVSSAEFNAFKSAFAKYQQGYDASAGNVRWGVVPVAGQTGDHAAFGDPSPGVLPTSGIATFNRIGGTLPTNNEGATGTITGYSPITINFTAQTISGSLDYNVPPPSGMNTSSNVYYYVTMSGSIAPNGTGTSTFSCSYSPGSCTNGSEAGGTLKGDGAAFGSKFQGLALGVATKSSVTYSSTTVTQTTATVQVYKNSTAGY